ncbi:hypothetical protein E5161_12080 [Cohnella pontilimi]|uniref:SLH domain-containing protein n=1 Tax=Cohnella pontilimi TaxID=2564100 RepID=A0A4U0FB50_9BACL|nr:Ig-like domain-containing protein [Cohnella pontilimi]TJY41930.1 hypothetical protein E5161_12080 [Cohnella pontilimi]
MPRLRTLSIAFIAAILLLQTWTFSYGPTVQAATGGPVVVSTYPNDNDVTVPANVNKLMITFDENISKTGNSGSSAAVTIRRVADNSLVESFSAYNSSRLSFSGKTVTISPVSTLVANDYYVLIDYGAFTSSSGIFSGIGNATTWNFTTVGVDSIAPVLSTKDPAPSATNVLTTTPLTLNFSERVTAASGYIHVFNSVTRIEEQTVSVLSSSVQGSGTTAITVTLPSKLNSNTNYNVNIDNGAFVDMAGNKYAGLSDTSWSFITKASSITAPTLTPSNGSINVNYSAPVLNMQFAVPVSSGTGKIYVKRLSDNYTAQTIDVTTTCASPGSTSCVDIPASGAYQSVDIRLPSLAANTDYYVLIDTGALKSATDEYDGIRGVSTWGFTTNGGSNPTVVSFSPVGSQLAPSGKLQIKFNQPVYPDSGTITIRNANGSLFCNIPVTSSNVVGGGTDTISITPCSALVNNSSYYVLISSTAFRNASNLYYAGITSSSTWYFINTNDQTPPDIVSMTPANGSTGVKSTNAVLSAVFSEPILADTMAYATLYPKTTPPSPGISLSLSNDPSDNKKIIFTPVSVTNLSPNTQYIVNIPSGAIKDLGGNPFQGILNDYRWTFTTLASSNAIPLYVSGVVNSNNTITLNYDQELDPDYVPHPANYYVTVNGVPRLVSSVQVSGNQVTLTMTTGTLIGQTVKVSYTSGMLRNLNGKVASDLAGKDIAVSNDTAAPILTSATALGSKVSLIYNETLKSSPLPSPASFYVTVGGYASAVSYVTISGGVVELTLSQPITSGVAVSVSYVPSAPAIADLAGNAAAGFNSYQISTAGGTTRLSTASVQGSVVTLTFSNPLNGSSTPSVSQFYVKAGSSYISASSVTVNGSVVLVSLASPVTSGQTASVTYMTGGTPLKDTAGQPIAAFSDYPLGNGSTSALPAFLETDPEGGLRLNSQGVSTSYGQSAGGSYVNTYTVDADKLITGYTQLTTMGAVGGYRTISVSIPSTETAGVVNIPVRSLVDGQSRVYDGAFRLNYGDYKFVFPLSAVNLIQEVSQLGGSVSTASLQLSIEKANSSSNLTSAINGRGLMLLASPVDFTATLISGNQRKELKDYNVYVKRAFVISDSLAPNPKEISVVRYDDQTRDIAYVPTSTQSANGKITVWFKRKGNSVYAVVRKPQAGYTDTANHWASSHISLLASKFIVDGTTPFSYSPNQNITRADFAKFIVKGLGLSGDTGAAAKFRDVSLTGAAAPYIGAASKVGIVSGGTDGKFRPDSYITREDMATMMLKAMQVAGVQGSTSTASLSRFGDRSKISSYALAPVAACVNAGIISGVTTTKFAPKENATRAQAAAMLVGLLRHVEFLP